MKCSRCQRENPPESSFCLGCWTRLVLTCSSCGTDLPAGSRFCNKCGTPVTAESAVQPHFASPESSTAQHVVEKILTSRVALEGERKQVTILFCDLANSTALAERLGPEAMHTLLNRFFELALAEVHRYGGTINLLGDGFMALFGAPLAYEDHARRAVLAAVGIQRNLKEGHAALGAQVGVELAVRVGLNTGLVVVGAVGDTLRMDYTAVGGTTNMAARLQQLAEPGAIYISESTHRAVQDHFDCRSLGKQMVKGRVEPILVYEVFGVRAYSGSVARRTIDGLGSPLVGRDPEFATFNRCIDRLCARRGGIMWVIGEAGLGKSRLVAEVRRQTAGNEPLWLEGPTRSFGQTSSYWPFLEIIKTYVGIDEDDRAGESWAKLEGRITALFPDEVAEILPYLATLMSLEVRGEMAERVKYLDEEAMGRQIFRASRRFFERLAQEDPLVLVFEDLHWVDQSSADLLEHLMPLVRKVPLLICGISRPDRQTPAAHLREIAATAYLDGYTEIYLSPLLPPDSASLARNLLEMHDSSSGVDDLIMQKAEGNPFFMEEVIRSLIVMGVVLRDQATGKWRATVQLQEIDIPDTIQAVILARIDRLQEDVKQVLKVASVIGRSFFYRVLSTLVEDEQKLDRCLDELQQVELIQERRRMPELEYIFKHTLVQEATYESILLDRRRQLHHRVGECIETLFTDRLEEEFSGVLAYHYVRAEEWEKAHDYLLKAGDRAGKVAADTEALAHYRQALTAYTRAFGERWDPLQRAILERKMGEALFRRGEHQQAAEYLERALASLGSPYPTSRWGIRLAIVRQLVRQAGHRLLPGLFLRQKADVADPTAEDRSRIYIVLAWIDYFINVKRLVLDSLMQLNLCEQRALPAGLVRGAMALGVSCDLIPAFWLGRRYHHRAVALAEQIQHPVAIAYAYLGLGTHEYHQGKWDTALQHLRRAAASYREAGELRGWGISAQMITWVLRLKADFAHSLEESEEIIRVGEEVADRHVWAVGLGGRGRTLLQAGRLDEAVLDVQKAVELFKAVPDYESVASSSADLGLCYLRQGKLADALAMLEESNQLVTQRELRGFLCTQPRNGLAEAYLIAAEQAEGTQRRGALRKAKRACQAALKQGKAIREGLAGACRLQGTYEWLRGKSGAAKQWWQRSVAEGEELEARYDLALTYLEIGRRLGRHESLKRATAIFTEIGASSDLARVRKLFSAESK